MESYDVVIIGGGIIGTSISYYIAKSTNARILVIEKNQIAQGNTSLAAGLLTLARSSTDLVSMVKETNKTINEIEHESGGKVGLIHSGSVYSSSITQSKKEMLELVSNAESSGISVELLSDREIKKLLPWIELPQDSYNVFMPEDGYVDGYSLCMGYKRMASKLGIVFQEQNEVKKILRNGNKITGVETNNGPIACSLVIDAAGVWAGKIAADVEIFLPMAPVRSQYWLTGNHSTLTNDQPFVILPQVKAYLRPAENGILFGLREKKSVYVSPNNLPEKMKGYHFKDDPFGWDSLIEGVPGLEKYFPLVKDLEIAHYIAGFSTYTPDGKFVLGGVPGVEGFLSACGCCGSGIAMSGGIGRVIAELALGNEPFIDIAPHRIDRFGIINPFDNDFLVRCAQSRSEKNSG